MIALKDIYGAFSKFIKAKTKLRIIDSDFDEPIERPSFRMFMDTVKSEHFSSAVQELNVYFNLYLYANGKVEIMDVQDKISKGLLLPLEINQTTSIYVNDLEFEKLKDNILNVSFNICLGLEFIDEKDIETMEKLYQK